MDKVTVNVKDIERIRRNSGEFKKFLNSPSVETLLSKVGSDLKPYLESSTGQSFEVKIEPSTEPRAGVNVSCKNLKRENFHNGSVQKGIVSFIGVGK